MSRYERQYARLLDAQDELASYREEFYLQEGTIYLDGNSLGLVSKRATAGRAENIRGFTYRSR